MELWIYAFKLLLYILSFRKIDVPETERIFNTFRFNPTKSSNTSAHLPVLLWHGMGDSYDSEAMQWTADSLLKAHPDLEIYSIYIDENTLKDKRASVWGDAMTQLGDVCEQIKSLDIDLSKGVNAMGFSQGGLLIRALVQTCDVKFHNVISIGSPQNGFADLPICEPDSYFCRKKNEYIKSKLYTDYMQENNIQAQYFRDINDYETYLEKSMFLKYVNNELFKNLEYYEKMISLNRFVMVLFEKDETLVPKETAWFYDIDPDTGKLIPFDQTDSYRYDLIGLKELNENRKIDFLKIDNYHLKMSEDDLMDLANTYL